ncbi:MAG: hypothetical protein ACFFC5_05685, partial [Promethearchaeota archaeon]
PILIGFPAVSMVTNLSFISKAPPYLSYNVFLHIILYDIRGPNATLIRFAEPYHKVILGK